MPFKSEKQRRYMWAHHPSIARRWSKKYGSKPTGKKKSRKSKARKRRKKKRRN